MSDNGEIGILRELARQYADAAHRPVQGQRRDAWRRHNSLKPGRPLIHFRGGVCYEEILPPEVFRCRDPLYRGLETSLRRGLFVQSLNDDTILEPWLTVRAAVVTPPHLWGLEIPRHRTEDAHGSWKADPPIKDLDDLSGLAEPDHRIDEDLTARRYQQAAEAVGDILPVYVDRAPAYTVWGGDIVTQLAHLRGLEQIMWDMADNPEGLHRLLARMRDSVLRTHDQAERAGDWKRLNSHNQIMPYAEDLPDPAEAPDEPAPRSDLWIFLAAQELTLVSPQMHNDFMLEYQIPIMAPWGLSAYGCCEDLTRKIDMLRRVPNLRRIAVPPRADTTACAEQIGDDYVYSWRPNPAEVMCCGFDAGHVEKLTRDVFQACAANGCCVDVNLKDIQTVENDLTRPARCVRVIRQVAEEFA